MSTTISVSDETYKRLKAIAHKGQTLDGILQELLDKVEQKSVPIAHIDIPEFEEDNDGKKS